MGLYVSWVGGVDVRQGVGIDVGHDMRLKMGQGVGGGGGSAI